MMVYYVHDFANMVKFYHSLQKNGSSSYYALCSQFLFHISLLLRWRAAVYKMTDDFLSKSTEQDRGLSTIGRRLLSSSSSVLNCPIVCHPSSWFCPPQPPQPRNCKRTLTITPSPSSRASGAASADVKAFGWTTNCSVSPCRGGLSWVQSVIQHSEAIVGLCNPLSDQMTATVFRWDLGSLNSRTIFYCLGGIK